MKLPILSGKEIVKALLKEGFKIKRQKGSHVHLVKISNNRTFHVTVPVHANRDTNPFVFRTISRQAGYALEDFVKLF